MKVGIIGYGYVGQSIALTYQFYDKVIRDPKLDRSAELFEFLDCDAVFVCVPSPETDDGHCDTSILESVLKDLFLINLKKPVPVICKTTAPPSVYKRLKSQYPNIVHAPEFLTERNAAADYANAEFCVLGGDPYWCDKAREITQLGRPLTHNKHIIVDIETAALFKYLMNSYLATKVSLMNDFKLLADRLDIDWSTMINLIEHDKRIGRTHLAVPGPDGQNGWGGSCFPKDVAAIIMEAIDLNLDFELLQRVEAVNKKHRNMK